MGFLDYIRLLEAVKCFAKLELLPAIMTNTVTSNLTPCGVVEICGHLKGTSRYKLWQPFPPRLREISVSLRNKKLA
jgi:hypothetical protein